MTQVAPGWYPDPEAPPGVAPLPRWWDGSHWTDHYGAAASAVPQQAPATTPDGAPLAGWWSRVFAVLIDGLILLPFVILVTVPFWGEIGDAFSSYWDDVWDSIDDGTEAPSGTQLQRDLLGPLVAISLISAAISLVYNVGFLMWRQATPGKLMIGLRVRLRERPGPMPFGTVLVRWLTQFAPSYVLGQVPFVGYLASVYVFADSLWPLGNGRKQAIHDLAANTNVIRVR
jgi:uncharacterized RDD family membrane protein YckC